MKKRIVWAIISLVICNTVFVACQKDKNNTVLPNVTAKREVDNNGPISFTINKPSPNYRISLETAKKYTKDFRDYMKNIEGKKDGEFVTSFKIPKGSLMDLVSYCERNGIEMDGMRAYMGRKNGEQTLIFVGIDKYGNDILPSDAVSYGRGGGTLETPPIEDMADPCLTSSGCSPNGTLNNNNP